jgi:hypothetical protein
MKFSERVETTMREAWAAQSPWSLSPDEVEKALAPIVADLHAMPDAEEYIRASFTHSGYEAMTIRLFKGTTTRDQEPRSSTRSNGQPLDTEA